MIILDCTVEKLLELSEDHRDYDISLKANNIHYTLFKVYKQSRKNGLPETRSMRGGKPKFQDTLAKFVVLVIVVYSPSRVNEV